MATSEKNTAPVIWTSEDNDLYELLKSNIDDLSEKDDEQFKVLREKKKNALVHRSDNISTIKKAITDLGISIKDLFDDSTIKGIAKDLGFFGGNKPAKTTASKTPAKKGNSSQLLLGRVGTQGRTWSYTAKQVYEKKSGQYPWGLAQFPKVLIHYGDSAESLLSIATPEGQSYFATAKGQAELAEILRIVEVAKSKGVKASNKTVAKKASATKAPAKKVVAKKAPAKKAVAKKAVAKKSPPKNASVPKVVKKKSVAKKIATKKATKP